MERLSNLSEQFVLPRVNLTQPRFPFGDCLRHIGGPANRTDYESDFAPTRVGGAS